MKLTNEYIFYNILDDFCFTRKKIVLIVIDQEHALMNLVLVVAETIINIGIGINIAWFRVDTTCTSEFFKDFKIARVRRTSAI